MAMSCRMIWTVCNPCSVPSPGSFDILIPPFPFATAWFFPVYTYSPSYHLPFDNRASSIEAFRIRQISARRSRLILTFTAFNFANRTNRHIQRFRQRLLGKWVRSPHLLDVLSQQLIVDEKISFLTKIFTAFSELFYQISEAARRFLLCLTHTNCALIEWNMTERFSDTWRMSFIRT